MPSRRYIFRRDRPRSNPLIVFILLMLVISGLMVNNAFVRGEVKPLFQPTPTATRMVNSYISEARTHFDAGDLDASVRAFEQALINEPNNGKLYAELARVTIYSSAMVTTDDERKERLQQALDYAKRGVELEPDDSTTNAILAFAYDWMASYVSDTELNTELGDEYYSEADLKITRAMVLDETNLQALTYYAEIMIAFRRFQEAKNALDILLSRSPDNWEVYRINATYLEYQAEYDAAIESLEKAVSLAPNMTFLYIRLGQSYRTRGLNVPDNGTADAKRLREGYFDLAMKNFEKAASLNETLGIKDPFPYLGIGYTYAQMGEFFIASRNMSKALSLNPYSPKVYADLGMVARQGKNYELAVIALQCGINGCDAKTSCAVRQCNEEVEAPIVIEKGLALNPNTVGYYLIYSATLAGMYVPTNPSRTTYCYDALDVISIIRSEPRFNDEPIYDQIMKESEAICANFGITHGSRPRPSEGGGGSGTRITPVPER